MLSEKGALQNTVGRCLLLLNFPERFFHLYLSYEKAILHWGLINSYRDDNSNSIPLNKYKKTLIRIYS